VKNLKRIKLIYQETYEQALGVIIFLAQTLKHSKDGTSQMNRPVTAMHMWG
jgi:hypothetical protein